MCFKKAKLKVKIERLKKTDQGRCKWWLSEGWVERRAGKKCVKMASDKRKDKMKTKMIANV